MILGLGVGYGMASLIMSLLAGITGLSRASFIRKTRQVEATQKNFLLTLLRAHRNTALGKEYGLAEIKTVEAFRQRVPILPYSSYEPYIERIVAGEENVLTPDRVIYLNLTSGSTGKQKLIPVTRRSRHSIGLANQASTGFVTEALRRRNLPIGKMILTSSVQLLGKTRSGIEYGPVSVGSLRMSSGFQRRIFAHPYEALLPTDSLTRHYLCLLFALRDRHTSVIGANFPILALRLCEYLENNAEDLIEDLETGTIAPG
jgi:GH3 auxin-responsive promoter